MGRKCFLPGAGLLIGAFLCSLGSALPTQAQSLFHMSLDTSPLLSAVSGPFSVDVQLLDGSGTGDGNNTADLSNFAFGTGGAPAGSPSLLGDAAGDLASTITLDDGTFLSELTQPFTPGDRLQFDLGLTNNADAGGFSDQFALAFLDGSGTALPTEGPGNALFTVDLASGAIQTFGTSAASAVTLSAPTVLAVPEPSILVFPAAGVVGWAVRRRRKPSRC